MSRFKPDANESDRTDRAETRYPAVLHRSCRTEFFGTRRGMGMIREINLGGRRLMVAAVLFFAVGIGLASVICPLWAVPDVYAAEVSIDYSDYAYVLEKYVDDFGLVDYKKLKAERIRLDAFAEAIGKLDPNVYEKWSKEEKIAFLINAYNALTLKLIIDHYPIQWSYTKAILYPKNSIRQIDGAWDEITFPFLRGKITLDGIEHERLRAKFNEPRIHMALVCAALGCPFLRGEPYQWDKLDAQLDDQTRRFLKHPFQFQLHRGNNRIYLSSIFKWFGDDFIKRYGTNEKFADYNESQRAVLNFVSKYLGPEDRTFLEKGDAWVEYRPYNWKLNEKTKENVDITRYGFQDR